MNITDYINEKKRLLLICLFGAFFFSILLVLFGLGISELVLLWIFYVIFVSTFLLLDYLRCRKRITYLLSLSESLNPKYLLAEVAKKPDSFLEQLYFRLIKTALKSMTDEVAHSNRLNTEYREYLEQWIHEIKVPITGIKLICENNKTDEIRKIMTQTELIEFDVEKILFYARLGSAEKDYLIREISLKDCVRNVLAQNKQFLIQSGVCISTEKISHVVCSDDKWIEFMLIQIISNSVKYRSSRSPVIEITSEDKGRFVSLSVKDNGVGIRQSEISRIFDKGFVGSNGRSIQSSTGIGLYLCRQLCDKLGMDIDAESVPGESTTVMLCFPKSDHLNVAHM